MLQAFGDGIWLAEGPQADVAGFRYPTRMAVIRLTSGGLFVWSPVALTDELRAGVDLFGEVRFVVAPNSLHHLHIGAWKAAYPTARLVAAPGLDKRRKGLAIDETLTDEVDPAWAADIDQVLFGGNAITTEAVFFHRASRTAIFTDLLQQFRPDWFSGWRAFVARLDLMTGPEPQVPRKFRTAQTGRAAGQAALGRILEWPTERVLMAHGEPVMADGQAFLQRAFRWLR